jgi:hypothetical protein
MKRHDWGVDVCFARQLVCPVRFTVQLHAISAMPNAAQRSCAQVLRPESHPALYSIVLGEGVLNDATSVALLRSVRPSDDSATLTPGVLAAMFTFFCYVFAASFALGATSGLAIAAAMKHLGPFSQPQARLARFTPEHFVQLLVHCSLCWNLSATLTWMACWSCCSCPQRMQS